MKSKLTLLVASLAVAFVFVSCQSSGTKDKKVAKVEDSKIDARKLKAEIVDIIMALPDNQETVNLINETGAAYVAGLTLEDINTDNLLTRAASAKAYGGVLFDLAYANTYNQVNTFSKLMEINQELVRKLGFESFINELKGYQDRYLENKENRDSVDQIVAEMLNASNEFIQENGSATDISLVFAGATTKSLYVISSVTLLAMNNEKLVDLMKNQGNRVESAYKILNMAGEDQEVKKMAESMDPVRKVYDNSGSFDLESVEKIREMTSFVVQ
jgi:hypothetical protein